MIICKGGEGRGEEVCGGSEQGSCTDAGARLIRLIYCEQRIYNVVGNV